MSNASVVLLSSARVCLLLVVCLLSIASVCLLSCVCLLSGVCQLSGVSVFCCSPLEH